MSGAKSTFRAKMNSVMLQMQNNKVHNERRERERRENRGVHSCHGCLIITDSSVIEDLLTAFHYWQEMQKETDWERRRRGAREGKESGGGGRSWGRLPGRVRALGEKRKKRKWRRLAVMVNERDRKRERESETGVCSNLVCVVLGEAPQHGWI